MQNFTKRAYDEGVQAALRDYGLKAAGAKGSVNAPLPAQRKGVIQAAKRGKGFIPDKTDFNPVYTPADTKALARKYTP